MIDRPLPHHRATKAAIWNLAQKAVDHGSTLPGRGAIKACGRHDRCGERSRRVAVAAAQGAGRVDP
jgi:hypothetical protein